MKTTLQLPQGRLLALLLLLLVACTPQPTPVTPTPTPVALMPTAVLPTATPLPTATALPTMTPMPQALVLWAVADDAELAALQLIAAEFSRTSGTPVSILPRPADALRLSLATAALVGDPLPDLLWGDQEALAGLIVDRRIQSLPDSLIPDDTLPALLTSATTEGQIWGLPVTAGGTLLLLYNQEFVAEPPTTSDAFIMSAQAESTPEVAGLVMGWNETYWTLPWLYAFGGAPTTPDGQTITLDTPVMTPTLSLLRELYRAAPKNGDSYARGQRLFTQGYASFAIDGDWAIERYRTFSDTLTLGIAPLPVVTATGRPAIPPLRGNYLMVSSELRGTARERALAFAEAMTDPAHQARLAQAGRRLPATVRAQQLLDLDADPVMAIAAATAAKAPGLPPTPAARCALYGMAVWLPSVLRDDLKVAEAPLRMQREAEACLSRQE